MALIRTPKVSSSNVAEVNDRTSWCHLNSHIYAFVFSFEDKFGHIFSIIPTKILKSDMSFEFAAWIH